MFTVYYCAPRSFPPTVYVAGSRNFADAEEFNRWLITALANGPLLITGIYHP